MSTTLAAERDPLARAVHKNLIRVVPLLAVAYFFNYVDRSNVGFAALTMNRDLGLTNTEFGTAAGFFFLGYCLLEVPSNLALYRFGARRWLARIMISWGLLSAATAFAVGPQSYNWLRLLTGAAEAGFFPGVLFYLSSWFPRENRVRVLAWFTVAIPLSSVIGGPVSVFVLQMQGLAGLHGWQWLFLIEGLPACLMGFLTLLLLRDHPGDASWLEPEERAALLAALERDRDATPKKGLLAALRDVRVWLMTGILFTYWLGINGIIYWLPLILKGKGMGDVAIGFLSAVPYLVASVVMIMWARHMDRTGQHLLNLIGTCVLAALGFVISFMFPAIVPSMVGITLAVVGLSSTRPAFYSLPARYLSGATAAGGMAFINSVGSLSGYVSPWMIGVVKDTTGSFELALGVLAVMLLVSAGLTWTLRLVTREI